MKTPLQFRCSRQDLFHLFWNFFPKGRCDHDVVLDSKFLALGLLRCLLAVLSTCGSFGAPLATYATAHAVRKDPRASASAFQQNTAAAGAIARPGLPVGSKGDAVRAFLPLSLSHRCRSHADRCRSVSPARVRLLGPARPLSWGIPHLSYATGCQRKCGDC
jgi:hypothetical protein